MRPGRGVGGYLRAEQFEGFLAGEAWVLSQIHLTHAARAQHPHNGVPGENLACPKVMAGILIGAQRSATDWRARDAPQILG